MGWQLVEKGRLPYVGSWDQNFPGIVYLHALSILIFGSSTTGFHTLDILLQLGFILILYHLTSRYFGRTAGAIAGVLYAGCYVLYGIGMFGQRDVFAGGAILAALSLALKIRIGNKGISLPLLAGLAIGVAMLIRPTNALCAIPLMWLLWSRQHGFRRHLLFSLGAALVMVAGLWPYLTDARNFQEFYTATIAFNRDIYGSSSVRVPLREPHSKNFELVLVLLIAQLVVVLWFFRKRDTAEQGYLKLAVPSLALALIIECVVFWMGKYFGYHFWPIICLMFPFAGYWLQRGVSRIASPRMRSLAYGLMTIVFLLAIVIKSPVKVLAAEDGDWSQRMDRVHEEYSLYKYNPYRTKLVVIDYIKTHVSKDEEIECCSMDNELVWMSERSQHSRFTMIHPLGMTRDGAFMPYQLEWRREFVDGIKSRLPKLVMLNSEPKRFFNYLDKDPATILRGIPGFNEGLDKNFELDTVIGSWSMYLRKR